MPFRFKLVLIGHVRVLKAEVVGILATTQQRKCKNKVSRLFKVPLLPHVHSPSMPMHAHSILHFVFYGLLAESRRFSFKHADRMSFFHKRDFCIFNSPFDLHSHSTPSFTPSNIDLHCTTCCSRCKSWTRSGTYVNQH